MHELGDTPYTQKQIVELVIASLTTSIVSGANRIFVGPQNGPTCHNPNLGLATKARTCKGASQEGRLGVTSRAPRSVRECEGMNLHAPK